MPEFGEMLKELGGALLAEPVRMNRLDLRYCQWEQAAGQTANRHGNALAKYWG